MESGLASNGRLDGGWDPTGAAPYAELGGVFLVHEWAGFADDLARAYGSDFVADFCKTLSDVQRAEEEMTFKRQRETAEANARIEKAWMEGLGEQHMSIDAEAFFYWVRRLGKDCWSDPGFIKEFKRDNPEVIVKCRKRQNSIIRP